MMDLFNYAYSMTKLASKGENDPAKVSEYKQGKVRAVFKGNRNTIRDLRFRMNEQDARGLSPEAKALRNKKLGK